METKEQKYAFLTVRNKKNFKEFALGLVKNGFKIVASRGTAAYLREFGIKVIDVETITGYPPLVGVQGIKIIHPKIFSGVLADKNSPEHLADLKKYDIPRFEIVACNFYPFEESISKKIINHDEAIFNLDIGGPAVVRCAAKNYKNVAILTDPADYKQVLKEINKSGGVTEETRKKLSLKAFKYVHRYDTLIIKYLSRFFKNDK